MFFLEPWLDAVGLLRVVQPPPPGPGAPRDKVSHVASKALSYLCPRRTACPSWAVSTLSVPSERSTGFLRRALVDRELWVCVVCRRHKWVPRPKREAGLPEDRVAYGGQPFSATGLDCLGLLLVRVGRRMEKRWGCLFNCLSVRAVHLEVVAHLDVGGIADGHLSIHQ